jgi:hypothetical protein
VIGAVALMMLISPRVVAWLGFAITDIALSSLVLGGAFVLVAFDVLRESLTMLCTPGIGNGNVGATK